MTVAVQIALTFVVRATARLPAPPASAELSLPITVGANAVLLVNFFVISSRLSRRVHESRALLAPSAREARDRDPRAPVLVLRSFADERQFADDGSLRFFSVSRSSILSFEERLTDRLWRFRPVVAIGMPGERRPAGGAARHYIDSASDGEWQSYVDRLARQCAMIVVVVGNTPGLAWEVDFLLDGELARRALFVVPPWMSDADWAAFARQRRLGQLAADRSPGAGKHRLLGFRAAAGHAVTYTGPATDKGYEALSVIGGAELLNGAWP
jgi:hypothetical protein